MTICYDLSEPKICVIDDCEPMLLLIRSMLDGLRAKNVKIYSDAKKAMEGMQMFRPDLVISDWRMDPVDGIELATWLRNSKDSPNPFVPIIMLTAYAEQERVAEARDAGVTEMLVKPMSVKSLYMRILTCIEKPRSFIRIDRYFGPDRRRRNLRYQGPNRRIASTAESDDEVVYV